MTTYGIEDCIAMSEDAHWFCFDKSLTRGRVMAIMADACMGDWDAALHFYKIRAGHVRKVPAPDGSGSAWHSECSEDAEGARAAWIVTS